MTFILDDDPLWHKDPIIYELQREGANCENLEETRELG